MSAQPDALDEPTRAFVASWLTPEQRADPDVTAFIHRLRRANTEEKASSPDDWTPEQQEAEARGDWMTFSRLRGYTEDEIANFGEFMRLARLLDQRYGEDFAITLDFEVTEFDQANPHSGSGQSATHAAAEPGTEPAMASGRPTEEHR